MTSFRIETIFPLNGKERFQLSENLRHFKYQQGPRIPREVDINLFISLIRQLGFLNVEMRERINFISFLRDAEIGSMEKYSGNFLDSQPI